MLISFLQLCLVSKTFCPSGRPMIWVSSSARFIPEIIMPSLRFKGWSGITGEPLTLIVFFNLSLVLELCWQLVYYLSCSGISTLHAVFISIMSLYFVFWSELFSDQNHAGLVTFRNSSISTFALGVSSWCIYSLAFVFLQNISIKYHFLNPIELPHSFSGQDFPSYTFRCSCWHFSGEASMLCFSYFLYVVYVEER